MAYQEVVINEFEDLAPAYDLGNRIMSLGLDMLFRAVTYRNLPLDYRTAIDIGAGTGDSSIQLAASYPNLRVCAVDLTRGMMNLGLEKAKKKAKGSIDWVRADGYRLPFREKSIDFITSSFAFRHFFDKEKVFKGIRAIAKPSSQMRIVDMGTFDDWKNRLGRLWISKIMGPLAYLLLGKKHRKAFELIEFTYTKELTPNQLGSVLLKLGFKGAYSQRILFGAVMIISAEY